jgi:AraC-like DNA-binding protein/quercetin dioxygenase-like cupin family protein
MTGLRIFAGLGRVSHMATKFNWESAVPFLQPQITNRGVHVWPFNPDFPLDVRFLLLNRKQDVPMHRPDHLELIYIESGEVVYQYQERQLLLKKGDIVIVGNNAYHRCRKTSDSRPQRGAVISFLPKVIDAGNEGDDDTKYLLPFALEPSLVPHVLRGHSEISTQIFDLMQRIHAALPMASEWSHLAIKTYLKMILVLLGNCMQNDWENHEAHLAAQYSARRLRSVFELVERDFAGPLTVADAANITGLSRWHFMRLFKQVTGQSFVEYLRRFRISKAQEFLASTDKSISDVSQQTGFCDQSYFGTVFRSLAKMTPLTYRRRFGTGLQPSAVSLCLTQHSTTFPPSFPVQDLSALHAPRPQGVYATPHENRVTSQALLKRQQN